jgi:hypothetical protein
MNAFSATLAGLPLPFVFLVEFFHRERFGGDRLRRFAPDYWVRNPGRARRTEEGEPG